MLNAGDRILESAKSTFLLYGYYCTTLHKIAANAGVHKSAIHNYFRTKEKLYNKPVALVLENMFTWFSYSAAGVGCAILALAFL